MRDKEKKEGGGKRGKCGDTCVDRKSQTKRGEVESADYMKATWGEGSGLTKKGGKRGGGSSDWGARGPVQKKKTAPGKWGASM